ncbi:28144_t:CDS:1, partial [Racocetra persica]
IRKEREEAAQSAKEAEEKLQREYDMLEKIANETFEKLKSLEETAQKHEEITKGIMDSLKDLKEKSCFWLGTQIMLESGRIIQMSELQVGDKILSNIRNGVYEFSDVYLIGHI